MAKGKDAKEEKMQPVKVTWKENEKWLHDYVYEHSSPSAWLKDLAIAEYKRQNQENKPQISGMSFLD